MNLFVRESGANVSVALADYDRVEFGRALPVRRRIKNLAQLSASIAICITLSDRLRWFRTYGAGEPDVLTAWKSWFRDVVDACRRKIVVEWDPIE